MKYYKRAEKKRDLLQSILCKCPVSNTVKMNVINLYRKLSSWNGYIEFPSFSFLVPCTNLVP